MESSEPDNVLRDATNFVNDGPLISPGARHRATDVQQVETPTKQRDIEKNRILELLEDTTNCTSLVKK